MFRHDHERSQRQVRLEQEENEKLDAEIRAKKAKKAADLEYQQKQIAALQNASTSYKLFYRTWSIVNNITKLIGHSLGIALKVIPPLNALVNGIILVIDLVEAIFLSEETRNRRAVKIINSVTGTGLTIAAAILLFNPATAPLGAVLSASAIGLGTLKEGFYWYKARNDLQQARLKLKQEKHQLQHEMHDFVKNHCHDEIQQIKNLNIKIRELESTELHPILSLDLDVLKQKKQAIIHRINYTLNNQDNILAWRRKIRRSKNNVIQLRKARDDKRKNFFFNLISFVGMTALAVSGTLVAAAVLTNPIALGVIGVSLLGVATAAAISNKFLSKKSAPVKPKPFDLTHDSEYGLHMEHISDTEHIVRKLAHESKDLEVKILKSDIEDYRHQDLTLEVKSKSSKEIETPDNQDKKVNLLKHKPGEHH